MQNKQRGARLVAALMIFGFFMPMSQVMLFGKKRTADEQRAYEAEKQRKADDKARGKADKARVKAENKRLVDIEKAKQAPMDKEIKAIKAANKAEAKRYSDAVKWYAVSMKKLYKTLNLTKQIKKIEKAVRKLKVSKVRSYGPKILAAVEKVKRKAEVKVSLSTAPPLVDTKDILSLQENILSLQEMLTEALEHLIETVINAKEFQADADQEQARLLAEGRELGKSATKVQGWK